MAKKGIKTNTLLAAGALAAGGGILWYAWSSGFIAELLGTPAPVEAVPAAPAAPATIPGVTDYPTLTETLNAPAPISTQAPYTPPAQAPIEEDDYIPPCPVGYTGTYPNCVPPTPSCPAGYAGVYPNCYPPAPPPAAPTCPTGWTGTYPACVPPSPVYTCPSGWTGTYPNCSPPPPVYKCPTNWTGTYPNCTPPVITPPVVTSTCVRNQSLCSSKYHGKCNTECQSPNSAACKGCRCACEGSANLALAFAGSRYDNGFDDRAYYVTSVAGR